MSTRFDLVVQRMMEGQPVVEFQSRVPSEFEVDVHKTEEAVVVTYGRPEHVKQVVDARPKPKAKRSKAKKSGAKKSSAKKSGAKKK